MSQSRLRLSRSHIALVLLPSLLTAIVAPRIARELRADELAAVVAMPSFVDFAQADDVPDDPPVVSACEAADLGDDELWFVSSRGARHLPDGSIRLHYWQYDGAGNWQTRSEAQFLAADAKKPICFHVHGNRVSLGMANYGGWRFYDTFTAGCRARPPLRFVIFSWPSDRLCGSQRDDLRTKAVRAEYHAFYLAWLVDRMSPEARIGLIGYSYGARLIGGALHLLGDGALHGRQLTNRRHPEPRSVRAALLAGALDADHLLPGRCYGRAPTQIDRLLVSRNACDPALKWYPLLYRFMLRPKCGTQAMGYVGFAGAGCVPALNGRIEIRDVTCLVGRAHEWHGFEHLGGTFLERMRQYVYFETLD